MRHFFHSSFLRELVVRESRVERELCEAVSEVGGQCLKWVSPGRSGVPDRIVIMPCGVVLFVELKAPGKTASSQQRRFLLMLKNRLGALAFVVDTPTKARRLIAKYKSMAADIVTQNSLHT